MPLSSGEVSVPGRKLTDQPMRIFIKSRQFGILACRRCEKAHGAAGAWSPG